VKLVQLDVEVARNRRKHVDVTAGCCNLERLGLFALLVNVDGLSRLYTERRAVDTLAVDENVTVNNHLTSLSDRASKTGTKYYCVEAHL
jgi:hypothetical protein